MQPYPVWHVLSVDAGRSEVLDGSATYGTKRAALRDAAALVASWRADYGVEVSGSARAGYRFTDGSALRVERCRDAECVECRDFWRSRSRW